LLESGGFRSAANVIFDTRLLLCADFVSANSDPVFTAALRIIIRSQNAPPMPFNQSAAPAVSESSAAPSLSSPPPQPLSEQQQRNSTLPSVPAGPQPTLTAKQQAKITAHLLGSLLIPLIKQANLSGTLIFFLL
jgi:hypothetical protein